jgi:hypothetical protein
MIKVLLVLLAVVWLSGCADKVINTNCIWLEPIRLTTHEIYDCMSESSLRQVYNQNKSIESICHE